jgi:hypothetical protein
MIPNNKEYSNTKECPLKEKEKETLTTYIEIKTIIITNALLLFLDFKYIILSNWYFNNKTTYLVINIINSLLIIN